MVARIRNKLFIAFIILLIIFSSQTLLAEAEEGEKVEITIMSDDKDSVVIYDYLKSNGYEITTKNKTQIVAAKKALYDPPAAPAQTRTEKEMPNTQLYKTYIVYGLGGGLLLLVLLFIVARFIRRKGSYQDEIYYETYPEYSYYNPDQSANHQYMNLFQRIEGMQVHPQYTAYYFSNNRYDALPVYERNYSQYDDNRQFSMIRQRQTYRE